MSRVRLGSRAAPRRTRRGGGPTVTPRLAHPVRTIGAWPRRRSVIAASTADPPRPGGPGAARPVESGTPWWRRRSWGRWFGRWTPSTCRRCRCRSASVDVSEAAAIPTGVEEFDRVLSGGLVPGSVTLLGGEPGIGKSTLLLQVLAARAAAGHRVLLVSAEESAHQVRLRAERLGPIPTGPADPGRHRHRAVDQRRHRGRARTWWSSTPSRRWPSGQATPGERRSTRGARAA